MANSAIYIDYNFDNSKYRNKPADGNAYYTYGFGSLYARKFKKIKADWEVQCWKADKFAKTITILEFEGVKHIIFPAIKLGRAGFASRLMLKHARRFIEENPRTVFNVSSFDHLLHYQISRLGRSCPVFVQHHGESPSNHKINNSSGLKSIYWRTWKLIEKRAFKRTAMLYLLDAKAAADLPVQKNQFRVSTTGVDDELFSPISKAEARKRLNLNSDGQYLLFIGRLNLSKRPDMLISAFLKLKSEFPHLGLLIGGCSESDMLYKTAAEAGAVITGMIPQDEVALWMSAADVYSLPLLDKDHVYGGIGMLPVQAMFCNTPAVGSTLKCFPAEALNEVGIYTDTEATLTAAIRDILSGKKTFRNARTVSKAYYSWDSIAVKTADDYLNAMDKICR